MELEQVVRTCFSCREFTDAPVTDAQLFALLDAARYAPSGGNRQGWRVVIVRDPHTKAELRACAEPALRVYLAQQAAGESPWNTVHRTTVDVEERWNADEPVHFLRFLETAPVLVVVGVDLGVVASFDKDHDRVGVISGASIYPFAWNILLAARNIGMGGALTTMCVGLEERAQAAVGFDRHTALAAVLPLGWPRTQLTKLSRKPVEAFVALERWGGPPLAP